MTSWSSRGLRGSTLEDFINRTNEVYREHSLALIQKIPTPITPINIDKASHQITLAYFDQKSTVDYIGAVQGLPVCFDAKECNTDTFPLQNIHAHQIEFMKEFEEQDGVAFFLIFYTHINRFYFLPFRDAYAFYQRGVNGGRKSFKLDELNETFFFSSKPNLPVPYLDMINLDLNLRKEEKTSLTDD